MTPALALYVPVFVAPERPDVGLVPCRAQIDTGASFTMAGGELAENLLEDHWNRFQSLPPPRFIYTADNNPILAFPIDSLLQVPVHHAVMFEEGAVVEHLYDVRIPVYVGAAQDGQIVGWSDCDMLVGMDLLSRFCVTIVDGTTRLDPLPSHD